MGGMGDPAVQADLAGMVKRFRDRLLRAGFVHANAVGELVSADGRTWVGTSYSSGEYEIALWRRERGYGTPEGRVSVRIHAKTDSGHVDAIADDLIAWAVETPESAAWPPMSVRIAA